MTLDSNDSDAVQDDRPVVLVLGDFAHEGLTAKIESLGFAVINKRLRSTPRNWKRIAELATQLASESRLALVFVYLPTTTLLLMAEAEYDDVRATLLGALQGAHVIFFVYETNLQGTIEPLPWEIEDTDDQTLEDRDIPWRTLDLPITLLTREAWMDEHASDTARALALVDELSGLGFELAPFRKRSDVTIRMFEALEDAQSGVFLRLYVPHGRYQSEQFEDFLALFSRYLRDVEGKEFSVDVHRTARGTTYVFKGRGEASSIDDLRDATKRFDEFLSLAQTDPDAASQALVRSGTQAGSAAFVVAKYARGIRRLHLEMRHEFERRRLLLNQALEADFLEAAESQLLPMPAEGHPSSLFAVVGNTAPVTINLSQATITAAQGTQVQQVVSGGMQYTAEDRELLQLIESLEDKVEGLRLRSELDRLKDVATRPEERRTAVQKLKSFLYATGKYVGKKIDDVGTRLLVTYLESLISGGAPR